MSARRLSDVAIVALALTALIAMAVAIVAATQAGSGDSPTPVVLATPTATASAVPPPGTVAPLFGAQVVAWVDSTPGPTPTPSPPPSRPDVRPCTADDLRISKGEGQGITMNQAETLLIFDNVASSKCKLSGVPSVQFVGPEGELLTPWHEQQCLPVRSGCETLTAVLEPDLRQTPIHYSLIDSSKATALVFYQTGYLDGLDGASPTPCPTEINGLQITLPDGLGSLTAPFAIGNPCLIPSVGQFKPAPTISAAATRTVFVGLRVPESVAAGSTLKFWVNVTNLSAEPYSFEDPCPNFEMLIYDLNPGERHMLNWHGVSAVQPAGTVSFAMEINIPADAQPGVHYVDWWADRVGGAEDASILGKTPYHVTVVPASP